jgi:hypothetical protein
LDALEGRFNDRECDAPTLADVHVWLLLFADDLVLTSESEVGLQQQLDTLQQFCAECGLTVNVKKTKVMVFNSVDPCQKFVFEDDIIERVQSFNYLGILLETTPNLDNAVEHLTAASRCSLFALNRRCAELHIMDIKLRCDLLNTLVRSIASYACEIWVDSKKIKVIEIVYRGFLKSLLRVRKTTSTSIVLVELNKFPFEHFAWGQTLLYYNRVSTVTKDYILGKAWEAQLAMLDTGKKCWAGSVKKWLLHNQPQEVTGFLPPIQSPLETTLQLVATRAFQAGTTELLLGIVLGSTHIHSTCLARLVQPVGGRSTTRGPINQEVGIPPLPGFPHTMLNVKRVKDNM